MTNLRNILQIIRSQCGNKHEYTSTMAIEPEEQGYEFSRNDKNQRIYYERDIVTLSDFQKIIKKIHRLEKLINKVVDETAERAAEYFSQKFMNVIEQ
ncbi:hypothetical protein HNO89_000900 [Sporosarcina luteola]|nr:hypothetical protein [Sporosarcina luteola]